MLDHVPLLEQSVTAPFAGLAALVSQLPGQLTVAYEAGDDGKPYAVLLDNRPQGMELTGAAAFIVEAEGASLLLQDMRPWPFKQGVELARVATFEELKDAPKGALKMREA